jgi:imidazolonepropionase-like amidohydrolase
MCLGLSFFLFGCAQAQQVSLAIRGTTVVDVRDGSLVPGQTVLIQGNRIVAVGPVEEVVVPGNAEILEAAATHLIPGLWDMHSHALGSTGAFAQLFKAVLANGVTGIRDPQPSSRDLAAMIAPALLGGLMHGPIRLVVAGNMVDGPNPAWPGSAVAATPERARAIVDSLVDAGAPFIKVYSKLWPPTYLAIAERARQRGIPFVGHVPSSVSAAAASDAGQRSIEHFTGVMLGCTSAEESALAQLNAWEAASSQGDSTVSENQAFGQRAMAARSAPFDEGRCRDLLELFARNETWQVPTLVAAWAISHASDSAIASDTRTRYTPRDGVLSYWQGLLERIGAVSNTLAMYERQQRIAGMMEEHGVPLLIGTDMPNMPRVYPGFSVHDEMKLLVETGLSPLYVLQGATINPARFFGLTDSLGTVEEGKLADLVLLEGNPLEDVTNTQRIRAVVANGQLYRRSHLAAMLEDLAAESARRSLSAVLSRTLEEQGFEGVREQYETLKQAAPDTVILDVWQLSDLGYALLDSGRPEQATAVLEWNVAAHPHSPYSYGVFAHALVRMGRFKEAVESFEQAVQVAREQRHPSLDYFQAQVRRLSGRPRG